MKLSFLHLFIFLSLILMAACAKSQEEPDIFKKYMVNPKELSALKLQIDLDGDGTPDKIVISGLIGSSAELSKTVTLVRPWVFDKQSVNTADLSAGSQNNFYIILSKTKKGYVVSDANPISILDTEAAKELFIVRNRELSESGLEELITKAHGDLLGIPTEAGIDTYLYWNGKTFVSFEPLEMP